MKPTQEVELTIAVNVVLDEKVSLILFVIILLVQKNLFS